MIEDFERKFLAFAKTKPAGEMYDSYRYQTCALAQFVVAEGYRPGATRYYAVDRAATSEFYRLAVVLENEYPQTWGGLVERLRAAGVPE